MTVAVQQISWRDFQSTDLNRFTELDQVGISMRYCDTAGKKMETKRLYGRQIAYRSISDVAYAVQGYPYGRVNLAYKRADSRHVVDILEYNHPRLGNGGNVTPKIHTVVVATA